MAALAFCIDTGLRDLENARIVAITTTKAGNDKPCDRFFKEDKPPVRQLFTNFYQIFSTSVLASRAVGMYSFCDAHLN